MYYRIGLFLTFLAAVLSFPFSVAAEDFSSLLRVSTAEYNSENKDDSLAVAPTKRIAIERIEVTGNTLFEVEIANLIRPYQKRQVSLEQLHQLKSKISQLYTNAGYVNSGAYLPEQKVSDGRVAIRVLEGGIGEINVSGEGRLDEDYIKSRLRDLSHPISTEALLDRLHALRFDPLIENISAELGAGRQPGRSVLNVDVTRADAFVVSTQYNNFKSPAIGTNARTVNLAHGNLLGIGDRFEASYLNTEGSNTFDFGYSLPFNSRNGRLYASYGFGNNDIVEDAFNALDIESESDYILFGVEQPIINQANHQFSLGLEFSRQHSETSLLNSPFALSRGADEEGNTNIFALGFSQEFISRGEEEVLALRSQFSFGLDAFDATDNNDGRPDSQYVSWLGQGQWVRSLGDDFPLVLQSNLQFASDNLLPLEQFRLGGINTVRGYRRDLLLGDNAFTTSAELRIPVWRPTNGSLVRISPFFDFGTAWNQGDEIELEVSTLASVGVGLGFSAGRFKARLDLGIPLTATEVDDQPILFSLGFGL